MLPGNADPSARQEEAHRPAGKRNTARSTKITDKPVTLLYTGVGKRTDLFLSKNPHQTFPVMYLVTECLPWAGLIQ